MGRTARVKSIDALQAMSAALVCFHDSATSAIDDLEIEIRRALQWIGHDCRQYWKQEVRLARDGVTEARLRLENARISRRIADHQDSCIDEKKALERAKRRLQTAESKVEAVTHWAITVERAVNEYRGSRSLFVNWLDTDFPQAVAVLGRMIASLETYVRLETPVDEHSPIDFTPKTSTDDAEAADETENDAVPPNPES